MPWTGRPPARRTAPVQPPVTGGQQLLRHINRVALLRLLRAMPGLSRAELAEHSGLTRSTVSLLTQGLIDEGWVAEDAAEATGALGRRPTPLRLDGRRFALVGAELVPDALRLVTAGVQGELLHTEVHGLPSREPEAVAALLRERVVAVVLQAQRGLRRQVLGVGIGLPGAVDAAAGVLRVAPNFGWRAWPVVAPLQQALDEAGAGELPVLAQNEADIAAIGEMEFGARPIGSPLVYVSCGIGLGSGIVVDDSLFTGAAGAAGEIGHTTLHVGGRGCSCGRLGCAEAYVGLRAIAAQIGLPVDPAQLQERLVRCDAAAMEAFAAAGRELGVLLHNLWSMVDPQLIVLGGETVALAGEHFVEPARRVLADAAERAGLVAPTLRVTRFAERAVAMGGAALVLRSLLQTHLPGATPGEKMISDSRQVWR